MPKKTLSNAFAVAGAILLVLFVPRCRHTLEVAQEAARIYTCASNIKQLSQAMVLYSQDWDERLPLAASWSEALHVHASASFYQWHCPDVGWEVRSSGYAYNSLLSSRRRTEFSHPETTPLVYDTNLLQVNAHAPGRKGLANPPRHYDHTKNAMGFLDGHVEHLDAQGVIIYSGKALPLNPEH